MLWSTKTISMEHPIRNVKTIAHRGGRETTIENTMESFQNAYNNNIDMIELDVHLTKDKKVVVFHDITLHRMTNQNDKVVLVNHINDFNYNELPKLVHDNTWDKRCGEESRSSYKQYSSANIQKKLMKGGTIPLFTEVLDSIPEKKTCILVEIKNTSSEITKELVEKVDNIIKKYPKLKDRIIWFSLHSYTCNVVLPKQNSSRLRISSAMNV
jgi:glycerophosphoryl diester phosphodiesterase